MTGPIDFGPTPRLDPPRRADPARSDAGSDAPTQADQALPEPATHAAQARPAPARLEPAQPEVVRPDRPAELPGAPHGYTRLPTGPVGVEPVVATGPDPDGIVHETDWTPDATPVRHDGARLAPWALVAAIVALVASFFVGWGIPLAIIAVIASIMSLRRPGESRVIARWALVLGILATLYSAGWLLWATMQFETGV